MSHPSPVHPVKTVQRHIWKDYEDLADDARYTPEYQALYAKRKEAIERVFADAKEKHAMRYTQYRGLAQVANWVKLKFAAMNLEKAGKVEVEGFFVSPYIPDFWVETLEEPGPRCSVIRVFRQTEAQGVPLGLANSNKRSFQANPAQKLRNILPCDYFVIKSVTSRLILSGVLLVGYPTRNNICTVPPSSAYACLNSV